MRVRRSQWWPLAAAATLTAASWGFPVAAQATGSSTIYVGTTRCSDSGPGSATQPYCTISKAATVVTAGKTVVVANGTYSESVTVRASGTASGPIVFTAASGAAPTLSGGTHGFYLSSVSYVQVNGFTVTHTSSSGIYVSGSSHVTISNNNVSYSGLPQSGATAAGIQLNNSSNSLVTGNAADHNTVAGIYLTNNSTGITVDSNEASWNAFGYVRNAPGIDVRTSGNTVTRNISHDNEDTGLQFYPGGNNNLVAGNVSYHNKGFTQVQLTNCNHPKTGNTRGCITGDHGIDDLNVIGNRIIGNSVFDNVSAGINVEGTSSNFTIANNVSVDNAINCPNGVGGVESCPRTRGNIRVDQNSTSGTTLRYDLVYLHPAAGQPATMMTWMTSSYDTLAAFQAASGQEAGGVQADPAWSAPGNGDFHLSAGSPAIDSADSSAPGELLTDITGAARVDDPSVPNTGVGLRAYDDRGAYEFAGGGSPSGSPSPSPTPTPSESATPTPTPSASPTPTPTPSESPTPTPTPTPTSPPNLVRNAGFETDTSGWVAGSGGSLTRTTTTTHSGQGAAAITLTAAGSDALLNDSPDWNGATIAGTTCTASAWVQGPAGLQVQIRLREYNGLSPAGYTSNAFTLQGATWMQISVSAAVTGGGDTLDLNIYGKALAVGQTLLVDDVSETCS